MPSSLHNFLWSIAKKKKNQHKVTALMVNNPSSSVKVTYIFLSVLLQHFAVIYKIGKLVYLRLIPIRNQRAQKPHQI